MINEGALHARYVYPLWIFHSYGEKRFVVYSVVLNISNYVIPIMINRILSPKYNIYFIDTLKKQSRLLESSSFKMYSK